MSVAEDNPPHSQIIQIQTRLKSAVPEIPILRDGEFCETGTTFLEALPAATVDIISKISASDRSPFQSEYCSRRSEQELLNAMHSNSPIALRNSIALGAVAIKYLQKDQSDRGIVISMFARTLRYRWQLTKVDKDLDDTIYYFQKTVEIEPIDEPNRALHFDDLGCALWERYTTHHVNVDFEEAKSAFENAAALPHSGKPMFLSNLGRLLKDKALFIDDGKKPLLDESLTIHLQAISCVTPEFRASIHSLHRQLAITYMEVFPIFDIDPAENIDNTVGGKVEASSRGWMFFYELACIIGSQFITSGLQSDADKSIALLRYILKADPHNKLVTSALVDVLDNKALSLKSQDLLTEAYQLSDGLLNSMGDYDTGLLPRLKITALLLMRRFDLVGIIDDVNKAISLSNRALASPLMNDSLRWMFQKNLGIQLSYRFNLTEQPDDLRTALENLEVAVSATGLANNDRADCLREYGRGLFTQYKVSKKTGGRLDEVIKIHKDAIELVDDNDQAIVFYLNDLANATLIKFENDGRPDDADQAVHYYLEAISHLERFPLIELEKPRYFVGLGNAFFIKFEMWDQIADLNQAIYYYKEAVDNSLDLEVSLPDRTGTLSRALLRKFQITRDSKYLVAAQAYIQGALDRQPPPSPQSIAALQNSMGISYLHAFDASNDDITFFDKAANCFQAALDTGCTQPFVKHPPIINLGKTLMGKYQYTKSDDDMMKAATQLSRLSSLTQNGNTNREKCGILYAVGKFCALVYDIKKWEQIARLGFSSYRLLAAEPSAVPEHRMFAALQASRLSFQVMHDARTATDILASVIKILPEVILMGPNRADHLRAAKLHSPYPSYFLSFSLAAGDSPAESLKGFEQTRCIIWNRLFDLNTDITHLKERHENLALEFDRLRNTISRLQPQTVVSDFTAPSIRLDQHRLAREYNDCLCLIRQQEGFHNFLMMEEPSRLQIYAAQGPVVILNGSHFRGDAIIITSATVMSLHLVRFDLQEYFTQIANFQAALKSNADNASTSYKSSLKWLWEVVAEPVLDKLGFTHGGQDLPRVWWLTNGWNSLLPIHAAGDHDHALKSGEPCTVIDRTISSYIPTLRALEHVRKSAAAFSSAVRNDDPKIALLVKMSTTPDDKDLTNVSTEISLVEQKLQDKDRFQITSLDRPRRSDVLPLLATSSMAHLACHGTADISDPSLSQLKLRDWKTAPLDVRVLLRNSLKKLQFVYLSACETAASKVLELREESIHLSAAFQMAGVPYTIATLWNIEDNLSVEIANDFYISLIEGQEEKIDFGRSAKALHSAVLKARERGVDVLLWGTFIHAGT